MGTRNYILEEMIKQLKHLKTSALAKVGEASTSKKASGPNNAAEKDNYESKLNDAIARLVASIPKPPPKASSDGGGPSDVIVPRDPSPLFRIVVPGKNLAYFEQTKPISL